MMQPEHKALWTYRRAAGIRQADRLITGSLFVAGVLAVLLFADWWFRADHIGHPVLFVLLSMAIWWGVLRLVLVWVGQLKIQRPELPPEPENGLSVAVFTTSSPGEPAGMFEKTLEACTAIRYPHTTYLLDDTEDHRFKEIAVKHGAVWMDIVGYPGAKAGKINEALKRTTEDFILILDPDHIPFPDFLHQTLGYFRDPGVGFVQVCQAYYNQYRSFVARAAAEQTYTFYGPSQMSLHGMGCATAIGANCTFRRKALNSIGGHGIGLAEDLITSIRIHAAGWKSVYNPVVVSRGLVPEDFGSFCKQQLKWSRGLFEVAFSVLPPVWSRLRFWQKLSYSVISTYYLTGVMMLLFILIPFIYFFTGLKPANMHFTSFALMIFPVLLINVVMYLYHQRWLCHPAMEHGLHWRGMIMKLACTPVFVLGFVLSLFNARIPYIPTAKQAVVGQWSPFLWPLLLHCLLFTAVVSTELFIRYTFMQPDELVFTAELTWGMIFFAAIPFVMSFAGLITGIASQYLKPEDPWTRVPADQPGTEM